MADDYFTKPQYKTRSASISAPASSSLEAIVNSQYEAESIVSSGGDGSTPYRRRKPATRSQSARIPQGRSVRKKVSTTQAPATLYYDNKTQFTSEPFLADDNESHHQPVRRGSQRRPAQNNNVSSNASARRKSNVYLDVPGYNSNNYLKVNDNDDTVIRTFSTSNKGIVNRGDSFRRRRSRSSSLIPTSPLKTPSSTAIDTAGASSGPTDSYMVCMLGAEGVGKAALISQFRTSECINAYESGRDSPGEQGISIILNGIESELKFMTDSKGNKDEIDGCDAFLVVYSVIDKASFTRAEYFLSFLQDLDLLRSRCCILIGNKIDLARSRAISSQDGKCLACTYRVKFIEVSVGINHNVDELFAGTLTQIRLKKEHCELQGPKESSRSWYKNRNVVRASMKARQMIMWAFGKEDSKFKNCENLTTL